MSVLYGGHCVGEEFSNKRLLAYSGINDHKHHLWMWECIRCKGQSGPSTISHIKRSDRCLKCTGADTGRWKGYEQLTGKWLGSYQAGAKKRNIQWNVGPSVLWEKWIEQDGKCAYTGRKLQHGLDASLDRINNKLGYIPGNVQWVHRDVNRMKSDFDAAYFIQLCKEVAK